MSAARIRIYPDKVDALNSRVFQIGSRSVIFRFYEDERADLGAIIDSIKPVEGSDRTFDVTLRFWEEAARIVVKPGVSFTAWAAHDLGEGIVLDELVSQS